MAARTDAATVKSALLRNYDTVNNPSLTVFINAASRLVDRVETCALSKGITLSTEELTDLETWIAAHFYMAGPDLGFSAKNTQSAGATFQGKTDMAFKSTFYGQQAILIDYSGCLNAISQGNRVGGFWLGTKDDNDGSQVNVNDV